MKTSLFLLLLLFLGFIARSRVIILASFTVFICLELDMEPVFTFLRARGIEIGLIFLLLSIFSSLVADPVDWARFKMSLITPEGLIAIMAGLLATQINGMGLNLLDSNPHLITSMIIGSIIGITLFEGIPVGPLMAAALSALMIKIVKFLVIHL